MPYSTSQICQLIPITWSKLMGLIRTQRLRPPGKNARGDYVWVETDLQRVRIAARIDRRKKEMKEAPCV